LLKRVNPPFLNWHNDKFHAKAKHTNWHLYSNYWTQQPHWLHTYQVQQCTCVLQVHGLDVAPPFIPEQLSTKRRCGGLAGKFIGRRRLVSDMTGVPIWKMGMPREYITDTCLNTSLRSPCKRAARTCTCTSPEDTAACVCGVCVCVCVCGCAS